MMRKSSSRFSFVFFTYKLLCSLNLLSFASSAVFVCFCYKQACIDVEPSLLLYLSISYIIWKLKSVAHILCHLSWYFVFIKCLLWLSITKGYEKDVVVRVFSSFVQTSSFGGNFCWNPKKIQREKEKKKNVGFLVMNSLENRCNTITI